MKARAHIILFLLCFSGTIAFYYLGLVWSMADFHPGSDVTVSPELTQRAERGANMTRLFIMPIMALSKAIGDDGSLLILVPVLIWVLVALYAGLIHLLVWASITGLRYFLRHDSEPSKTYSP